MGRPQGDSVALGETAEEGSIDKEQWIIRDFRELVIPGFLRSRTATSPVVIQSAHA
jgi:hypothetical protein